ncbi:MAG: uncharacterized protein QOG23_2328 [Blastocatellia bacterium]|jgi:predicted nucleic acid-binding protein|nr:uncharacterized protein [Blastocatellia bacterium]
MSTVFADTLYWIALINSRDQWHERAVSINADLSDARLVTTDSVLTELARAGEFLCGIRGHHAAQGCSGNPHCSQ